MSRDRGGTPAQHRGQKPPAPPPRPGRPLFSDCGVIALLMLCGVLAGASGLVGIAVWLI